MRIAALITCHNRRDKTLRCLNALFECQLPEGVSLGVFLVDDGSSDGTAEAVQYTYPQVDILQGDGSLYWNGGMRKAFAAAMECNFDYYLWLNDDTYLYHQTINTLLQTARDIYEKEKKSVIVVGSTQAEIGARVNHGGIVKWKRLNSELVEPQAIAVPCQTMFGNCVLVPNSIAHHIGNLDSVYVHSIGDVDYGLRVRNAGFSVVVMAGFAGICESNPIEGSSLDSSLPIKQRFQQLLAPKGLPIKPLFVFLWRHFGVRGGLYGIWIYSKVLLTWMRARIVGSRNDKK